MNITYELIEKGASDGGGWTAKQLAILGVSWPPKGGWKERVIGNFISTDDAEMFLSLKNTSKAARATKEIGETARIAELEAEVEHWKRRYYEISAEMQATR